MKMRRFSAYGWLRSVGLMSALAFGAFPADEAGAAAVNYVTEGQVNGSASLGISYSKTEGTFEAGQTALLGRFVIAKPAQGTSVAVDDVPFVITLLAPDLHREVTGGPSTPVTKFDSSLMIEGRLNGVVDGDGLDQLTLTFTSLQIGSHLPYTLGHVQKFEFPIPLEDLSLPIGTALALTHDPTHSNAFVFVTDPLLLHTVPEPGAAWVLAAGLGAFGLWRRSTR